MPKKSTARRKTHAAPPALPMPLLISVIGSLVGPDLDGLSDEFREAWAHAPAVAQSYIDGTDSSIDTTNRGTVIQAMVERSLAERRATESGPAQRAAQTIDRLDSDDPDCLTEIELTYGEPAFFVGLTLGLFLLTNGRER